MVVANLVDPVGPVLDELKTEKSVEGLKSLGVSRLFFFFFCFFGAFRIHAMTKGLQVSTGLISQIVAFAACFMVVDL